MKISDEAEQLSLFGQDLWCGKTFLEHSQAAHPKLTVNIPEETHQKVRDEVASDENLTTSMVILRAIEAYYSRKEGKAMNESTKTLALQISEELFDRMQDYLAAERQRTGKKLTQKAFIIGLIEKALDEWQLSQNEPDEE